MREDYYPSVPQAKVHLGHHTLSRAVGQEFTNFKTSQGQFLPFDFSEAAVLHQADWSCVPSGLRAYPSALAEFVLKAAWLSNLK